MFAVIVITFVDTAAAAAPPKSCNSLRLFGSCSMHSVVRIGSFSFAVLVVSVVVLVDGVGAFIVVVSVVIIVGVLGVADDDDADDCPDHSFVVVMAVVFLT